ncbi:hypothetical protein AOQ84DRAFT_306727 [Glonium stellatum]|uniref:Dynamin family protein n=1 Tax=Glonium stellatum TaxID=574774 RepID=A0A8E2JLS8_9PEZI|nr:hypothetical protein AOQ84DRAFT_306727 [Glonium stellatum]
MDPDVVTTSSLEALQSDGQRKIMDVVDKLRRTGLNGVVQLPQLVVCGDQSSGKSSVLEAITEIPFPRKENLCTRFATEIVLRRDHTSSISTKITPDKTRPDPEQAKLRAFNKSIHDFSELPALMDEATSLMGLEEVGQGNARAFSRDVLSIEICGPGRPQLTLVDLPGLIHSENKSQSKEDVRLIRSLVEEYISNERTIILAVVSAKNDYANQIILDHCRRIDDKGSRTLGIITKPDFLRPGSDNEKDWIDLAQNRDIYFELGWHMLKNRADGELGMTFQERNASERMFFNEGRYRDLPRDMLGIEMLRTRLSQLLNNHLKKELPHLKKELDAKLKETVYEIERLGGKRTTTTEQRMFLMSMSMTVNDILKSAVKGHYENSFFGSVKMDAAVDSSENIRRFRAVIQHLNLRFAKQMGLYGHKYAIPGPDSESEEESSDKDPDIDQYPDIDTQLPKKMTRSEAISWVKQVLERSRGCELPGNFNPLLISQLFWDQSEPWNALATAHIHKVADVCNDFVKIVLPHAAPPEIESRLVGLRVEVALESSLRASREELAKIIADKARPPMTYNHYYTTTVQKQRQKKYAGILSTITDTLGITKGCSTEPIGKLVEPHALKEQMESQIVLDMDKFSAEEALDSQAAYYKDELKYFIAAVTKQVIERHLVDTLPATILSPMVIAALTDEEVAYVAAEAPEVTRQRNYLQGRKEMLEKGQDAFRLAMGGVRG